MNRADANVILANLRRAGNPAADAKARELAAVPTVAGGAVRALDTLEARFDRRWADLGGPALTREYQFDAVRKWRFDRCHEASKVAVELDGGVWKNGRHNRAKGYIADCEKLNQATAQGWAIFRLTPAHLDDGVTLNLILRTVRERMEGTNHVG